MNHVAIYPGSFDPFTNEHLDILGRAASVFDKVIVTIAVNSSKTGLFSDKERIELIRDAVRNQHWSGKVEVEQFTGLLVDYARQKNASVLIRGIRQVADFEYELRMALANLRLAPEVDTAFLMPDEKNTLVSTLLVREIATWGGELSSFVPPNIASALRRKFMTH